MAGAAAGAGSGDGSWVNPAVGLTNQKAMAMRTQLRFDERAVRMRETQCMCNLAYVKRAIAAILVGSGLTGQSIAAGSKVELRQSPDKGWELLRDGEPYFIRGVGGPGPLDLAAKMGANSVRYWGIQYLDKKNASGKTNLEQIEELGMTVCAGIWVEHERHGFSYLDPKDVREQREKVREAVRVFIDEGGHG